MQISTSDLGDLREALAARAIEAGFDTVRVTRPDAVAGAGAGLDDFLANGFHGSMDWMARHADRRRHPSSLWPEVRSIIVLGLNYGPERDPLEALARRDRGTISCYAQGRDYHDVVKKKLKQVARWLQAEAGGEMKVFVDTAPVM